MGIINIKRLTEQAKQRKTIIILDIIGLLLLFATPAFIIAVTDKFKLFLQVFRFPVLFSLLLLAAQ